MIDRLRELQQKHQIIGDVRGRGLMIGIELVRDRVTKERATTERDKVVDACYHRGLLVLGAGKNAIRISPPLVLTKEQAATAVRIIDEALSEAYAIARLRGQVSLPELSLAGQSRSANQALGELGGTLGSNSADLASLL